MFARSSTQHVFTQSGWAGRTPKFSAGGAELAMASSLAGFARRRRRSDQRSSAFRAFFGVSAVVVAADALPSCCGERPRGHA